MHVTVNPYRIEHLDRDGRWYIVADRLAEHDAHRYCAHYRRLYPRSTFRIVGRTWIATEKPRVDYCVVGAGRVYRTVLAGGHYYNAYVAGRSVYNGWALEEALAALEEE